MIPNDKIKKKLKIDLYFFHIPYLFPLKRRKYIPLKNRVHVPLSKQTCPRKNESFNLKLPSE